MTFKVTHLNCATLCPFSSRLSVGHGSWLGRGTLVAHCLLVETPNAGLVLIDTGFGTGDVRDPVTRVGAGFVRLNGAPRLEETALSQVERLGFQASDVRHIVLSHLDLDHAGGLGDFPEATVHVMAAEHDAAMARATYIEQNRYRPQHWEHGPKFQLYTPADGEPWRGFRRAQPLVGLPEEIFLMPLAGHTRGHACVGVQGGQAPDGGRCDLVYAGDAYFHRSTVRREDIPRPYGLLGFEWCMAWDKHMLRENHDRLRRLATSHDDVRVFCAHDPEEFAEFSGAASVTAAAS